MLIRAALALAVAVSTTHAGTARDRLVTDPIQFEAAVKSAKPGDVILLADGEWRDFRIVFTGEGLPGQPITLAAVTEVVIDQFSKPDVSVRRRPS